MDKQLTVMIARLTHGGQQSASMATWLATTAVWLQSHPWIKDVQHVAIDQAPVACARNLAAKTALAYRADLLVMVDHDIVAHRSFMRQALELFIKYRNHGQAAIIAAPAICGDGKTNVLFHQQPVGAHSSYIGPLELKRLDAMEASFLTGVQEVSAVGTGCIAIDVGAFRRIPAPWFYLEFADEAETQVATGEDVAFTRDCSAEGIPVLVHFDCWAEHEKTQTLRKPTAIRPDMIPSRLREAFELAHQES